MASMFLYQRLLLIEAKHLVNEPETLVVEGLRGILRANPELSLIEHERGTDRANWPSLMQSY